MIYCLIVLVSLMISHGVLASDSLQQLIAKKKYAEAIAAGEQLLGKNPQQISTRFLTAYANQMSGNTERAIELYEALIKDEPGLPEPRNNLALIYLARGDYDYASQFLVSAINTRISYAIAYANLSQVYKGIASEAYRRAISQSSEPAKYTHDIELTPITWLDIPESGTVPALASVQALPKKPVVEKPVTGKAVVATNKPAPTPIEVTNQETLLIEKVKQWAQAWSSKDFDNYTASYVDGCRSKFDTRQQWLDHRRDRILRPGKISVEVSDFAVKRRGDNRASVDFTQAFDSPGYSDRVVKRLDFERIGSQWKIAAERV